jgi:hypothetical protein
LRLTVDMFWSVGSQPSVHFLTTFHFAFVTFIIDTFVLLDAVDSTHSASAPVVAVKPSKSKDVKENSKDRSYSLSAVSFSLFLYSYSVVTDFIGPH